MNRRRFISGSAMTVAALSSLPNAATAARASSTTPDHTTKVNTHMPDITSPEQQRYRKMLTEYATINCTKMLREPIGLLKHPFIVPGSVYQDSLWDWDSWLANVAISQLVADSPKLDKNLLSKYEKGSILNFLEATDDDGWMPICISVGGFGEIFEKKGDGSLANMHKPVIAQHAAFIVKAHNNDAEWLRPLIGKLEAFLGAYERNFKHAKTGLFYWKNDLAIGVDNDPSVYFRPPNSCGSIYLNCLMVKEMLAMGYIAEMLGTGTATTWRRKADALKAAINEHCWDERDGSYYSVDLNLLPNENIKGLHENLPRDWDCLIMRIDAWSNFMALWAGVASTEQAARVVLHARNTHTFNAPYGIRTLSKMEKMYNLKASGNPSNWLGPIWGITNYMVFRGLADYGYTEDAAEIAIKSINLFGRDYEQFGSLHEYYNPDTGEAILNANFQNWNLLVLNMIAWLEGRHIVREF